MTSSELRDRLTKDGTAAAMFQEYVNAISFGDWHFAVRWDGNRMYLQIEAEEPCRVTGEPYEWKSRKWFLSPHMTKSEVIQTAFKAALTAVEHEAREAFKYKGKAIFGPHFDVDRLHELCGEGKDALDVREKPAKGAPQGVKGDESWYDHALFGPMPEPLNLKAPEELPQEAQGDETPRVWPCASPPDGYTVKQRKVDGAWIARTPLGNTIYRQDNKNSSAFPSEKAAVEACWRCEGSLPVVSLNEASRSLPPDDAYELRPSSRRSGWDVLVDGQPAVWAHTQAVARIKAWQNYGYIVEGP